MNPKIWYGLVALVAVAFGFIAAQHWPSTQSVRQPAAANSVASKREPVLALPEFTLKNRAGELQSIRSWPGKSLVINFWATWCAPCRREIPLLKRLQQQHAADGVQVVGIAVDFREDVLKYADEIKLDYPLLIGEQDGLAAVDAFGIETVGFPFTVFTDNRGDIVTTHLGELHAEQAALILSVVQQVNRGELPIERARTQVAAELMRLQPAGQG